MLRIFHSSYARIAKFRLDSIENGVKKMQKKLFHLHQVSLRMTSALIILKLVQNSSSSHMPKNLKRKQDSISDVAHLPAW